LQLKKRITLVKGLNQTSHNTSWHQPCNTCNFF